MRIWSKLLIKFDLKWCIHLSTSLFSYLTITIEIGSYVILYSQMFQDLSRNHLSLQCRKCYLLPNAIFKSIVRISDCCTIILHYLAKRATEKNCWPVNKALLTGNVKNDVTKRQMSHRQRRSLAYCWQYFGDLKQLGNKTVFSRLLGKQSNRCLPVVEKNWETVALCLWQQLPRSSPLPRDNKIVPRKAMK